MCSAREYGFNRPDGRAKELFADSLRDNQLAESIGERFARAQRVLPPTRLRDALRSMCR